MGGGAKIRIDNKLFFTRTEKMLYPRLRVKPKCLCALTVLTSVSLKKISGSNFAGFT